MSEIEIVYLISAFTFAYAVLLWKILDIRDDVRNIKRTVDELLVLKKKAEQENEQSEEWSEVQ